MIVREDGFVAGGAYFGGSSVIGDVYLVGVETGLGVDLLDVRADEEYEVICTDVFFCIVLSLCIVFCCCDGEFE